MQTTSTTEMCGVSIFRNAVKLFGEEEYEKAMSQFLEVLDADPLDWYARLLLGACYYKSEEFAAAERIYQYIYQKCSDEKLVRVAVDGFRASRARASKSVRAMPEHDRFADSGDIKSGSAGWMESSLQIVRILLPFLLQGRAGMQKLPEILLAVCKIPKWIHGRL